MESGQLVVFAQGSFTYLFSNPIYDGLQMSGRNHWHYRGIHDPQVLGPVYKQIGVDHTSKVKRKHGTTAARMVFGPHTLLDHGHDGGVVCRCSGRDLVRLQYLHRSGSQYLTIELDGCEENLKVYWV